MIVTEPLTATRLYDTDSTFHALVDQWVEDRRCPLPMVDLLMERDLYEAAEVARWAAMERKKPVYLPLLQWNEQGGKCGPYPSMGGRIPHSASEVDWYWKVEEKVRWCKYASSIWEGWVYDVERRQLNWVVGESSTPAASILWLLDNMRMKERQKVC